MTAEDAEAMVWLHGLTDGGQAEKGTDAPVRPQLAMSVARDADPQVDADGAVFPDCGTEPQFSGRAQIEPVLPQVRLQWAQRAVRNRGCGASRRGCVA